MKIKKNEVFKALSEGKNVEYYTGISWKSVAELPISVMYNSSNNYLFRVQGIVELNGFVIQKPLSVRSNQMSGVNVVIMEYSDTRSSEHAVETLKRIFND